MHSRIRSCKTHTRNLRIPNSRKIPGPKNRELRGFTDVCRKTLAKYLVFSYICVKNMLSAVF